MKRSALWRLVAQAGVTYAGTGAPYLLACLKEGVRPAAVGAAAACPATLAAVGLGVNWRH